jgi:hypothetical protein
MPGPPATDRLKVQAKASCPQTLCAKGAFNLHFFTVSRGFVLLSYSQFGCKLLRIAC